MKYSIITNNNGALDTKTINSKKGIWEVCENEYNELIDTYKKDSDDFELTDKWETEEHSNADKGSYIDLTGEPVEVEMGVTIDYCMGHEYIYGISVKVIVVG